MGEDGRKDVKGLTTDINLEWVRWRFGGIVVDESVLSEVKLRVIEGSWECDGS